MLKVPVKCLKQYLLNIVKLRQRSSDETSSTIWSGRCANISVIWDRQKKTISYNLMIFIISSHDQIARAGLAIVYFNSILLGVSEPNHESECHQKTSIELFWSGFAGITYLQCGTQYTILIISIYNVQTTGASSV